MKMQEMNEAFEKEGFDVKRDYVTDKRTYVFTIRKDDVFAVGEFTWNLNLSNHVNHERQMRFITNLIGTWEKEYEKINSRPKPRPYDLYQLQRTLAEHGGKAKLVVNENVYPVRINEVSVDSSAAEVPKVSVEGDLMSFVPESRTCLARYKDYCKHDVEMTREMYRIMVNSLYGNPVTRANPFAIEKVIFNGPATIVMWTDGTKTIVKCQDGDTFDPEKGLAMAISKKAFGNKGNYCDIFKKALKNCDIYYEETVNNDPHIGDVYNAYQKLLDTLNNKKATKSDLGIAMEEAIGYLGHALG